MQLIVVESPTKSKTIEKFLGPKYKVVSSFGHVRDLPKDELGVDTESDFTPKYIIPLKSRKNIQSLKEEVKKAQTVILATDEDREGESIAWHLSQILQLNGPKTYQRIVFHEITKPAIEEALKNPRKIDMNLVDAQQARRVLDRIVGYKLSPFLWKKVARGLSAGRVQSVAVKLVCQREEEIKNFVPQEYWTITALLLKINPSTTLRVDGEQSRTIKKITSRSAPCCVRTVGNCEAIKNEFEALLVKEDGKVIPKLGTKTKEEADKIVKDLEEAEYKVVKVEKKETKRNPLPPFTTSTLQQEAWQRFRLPARSTMRLAQKLYEKGYTTYHRTDSLNLSNLALLSAKKFIVENYGKEHWAGFLKKYKAKGRVQEAHEAIRPTFSENTPEKIKLTAKLEDRELRLYDLIWRRFVACQMAQASFDSTVVEIEALKSKIKDQKSKIFTFRTTGQTLKFDGFLKVYPIKYKELELPPLEINEVLELIKLTPGQHFTQPLPRYTEATLIKTLEENGIGRPSTYASIISTVQERNYIEKDEQKRFKPTEIGTVVNGLLVNHFPKIVNIKFTAEMEENLDKIAQGKEKWVPVIRNFYEPFERNLEKKYQEVSKKDITEKPTEKKCPKCKAPLLIRLGKFGEFYACSKFPKCRYTESLKKNTLGIQCPQCKKGEITEKRTKRNKIFYGCSNWPKCKVAVWDKPTGEICSKCKSLLIKTKRDQVKCSNRECGFEVEK